MMPYGMGRGGSFFWSYGPPWVGFWPHGFPFSGWPPFYPPTHEEEEALLAERAEFLEDELERIRQRLKELRKSGTEKKDAKQT